MPQPQPQPQPRTYPHGVTCWIDTQQPDLGEAARFYTGLFGWTLTDAMPPDVGGSYLVATLDGQDVAALAPATGGTASWNTYVAVDDVDVTAAAVDAAGGRVVGAPADAGPGGRAAVCRDPGGAEFRLWQPRRRPGAQLVNVPGTWNFSDLHTHDAEAALAFYAPLFGWVAVTVEGAGTMLQVPGYGDHLAATVDPGIHERQRSAPPGFADVIGGLAVLAAGEPAHWHVTFSVADRDGSVATAERLGATVLRSGEDMWTRHALLRDPQGAELTVSQFTPPDGAW
ncbi:VOC family protein [Cellulomonas aerilata]|uniref:Hydroxylase n=1 Tax=Cellulomonas aerilata TaxID=515326 RepID=A0A512D864_9CELL|nr:VOC family protein [Cellulomonas aerilata]GEO32663.1 hydroxylase [Cellulomonas aerilata]